MTAFPIPTPTIDSAPSHDFGSRGRPGTVRSDKEARGGRTREFNAHMHMYMLMLS